MSNIPTASVPATPADPNAPRWRLRDRSDSAGPVPVVSFEFRRGEHECCASCEGMVESDWRATITMPGDGATTARTCFCAKCLLLSDDELRAALVATAREHYTSAYQKWAGVHPRSLAKDDKGFRSLQSWVESEARIVSDLMEVAEGFAVNPENDMDWLAQVPGTSNPAVRVALREVALGSAS